MNIHILYATYSGGTEAAAHILKDALERNGHAVSLESVSTVSTDTLLKGDCLIFCTPTWTVNGKDGQPHEDFLTFMGATGEQSLEGKQFAVCGLGDSSYPAFCGSVDILEQFIRRVKGTLAVPSLRVDGFYCNQEENINKITGWAQSFS